MGNPKIEDIKDIEVSLASWEFLTKLPEKVGNFLKQPGRGMLNKQVLSLIRFVDAEHHRCLELTYTKETFDYVPVKIIGLHSFRDERYFCRDKEKFAQLMLENLETLLQSISVEEHQSYDYDTRELGFESWDYWKQLPERIGSFELFIRPDNPQRYINGSCIFLDYSDFEQESTLYFLCNGARVEVFGEMLQHNVPVTTKAFTVPEENEYGERIWVDVKPKAILPKLEEKLEEHLYECLEELGKGAFHTI